MATIRLDDFVTTEIKRGIEPIDAAVKIPKAPVGSVIARADDAQDMVKVPVDSAEKKSIFARYSKGIDIGIGQLPQLAGRTLYMFGDALMGKEDKKDQRGGLAAPKNTIARRIRNAGINLTLTTENSVDKRFPESKQRDFVRDLGTGTTSIAASLGLGYMFGPIAAGVAFGGTATVEGFFEARQEKPTGESLAIASALGIAEGSLEFIGLDKFIKVKGNFIQKILRRSLIEATQEASQSVAEGTIKTATGVKEFKGWESVLDIAGQALYEGALGAVLGGSAGIAVGAAEQRTVKTALKELGATEEQASAKSKELMKESVNEVLNEVENVTKENEAANEKIPDAKKEEAVKVAKEEEISLEQVQEKQARQKVQEDKLSKEEIQRFAVERVKDEQLKGRLTKLDTDVRVTDKQIDSLERERRNLKKADKATKAVENKIDALLKKRDSFDVQRADILTTAKDQFDLEKEALEVKGETLTKVARQGIKDAIRAKKEGKALGKQQVETVQLEALQVLQDSTLDRADKGSFIKTIKNIKTEAQLEKAIPKIETRIEKLEEKATRRKLVKKIQKAAKAKISPDYKAQIDSILESFDLKSRTEATEKRRESRMEFLARERQEGNLDFLPPDFFANLGTTTLDKMTTEQLQEVHDQVAILAHVGSTKKRMLAEKGLKDLDTQARESAQSIYDSTNSSPSTPNTERWTPVKGKRGLAGIKDKVDAYFAGHRKVEFIARTLGVSKEVFEKIQSGVNKETTTSEAVYGKLNKSFQKFEKELSGMMNKEEDIPGVGVSLTREQMIGVALNSGNVGNMQRLLEGNELTQEEIQIINDQLTDKERAFVSEVFEILESTFPETAAVTERLYGVRPPKVEGNYFPIIEDFKTSAQAQLRQASEELFNSIFKTTYINRAFTHRRVGGTAPVNLSVFQVLLNHIDGVIHYNSLAAEVRDVQKLIKHPTFQQAISDTMGDNIYGQFPTWLRDVANPQSMRAGNIFDRMAQGLRHNSTASLLAHRVSVSLLQGGSYFQTVNEIGVKYAAIGLKDFHSNRKASIKFAYAKSPDLKNRRKTFDREVKDFLKSEQVKNLTKDRTPWNEIMFSWITGIDQITTVPSWLGAYQQGLDENNGDEGLAAEYADGVVRRTQPTGSVQNLSAVMRGSQWQKMFTMFMSHFANMHNQMVSTMDQLKYSKAHPMRKFSNFGRSMFWLWVAPAMLSSIIRAGGDVKDWKKHLKELVLYPFAGLLLIRDVMNMLVKGFDFGAPPALAGAVEFGRAVKSKDPQKKLRHGVKAIGIFSGKIPTQYADTLDGAIDLYNDETDDFRRLFMSEWALKPSKSGKKGKRRTRRR